MSTDVAKLLIVVGTKGTKETKKDLDGVTKSSKQLGDQTKKTNKEQSAFSETVKGVRNNLAPAAAAYYMVSQAVSVLSSAYDSVKEAYLDQIASEIKLQTILNSTGHAIGQTSDQLAYYASEWQKQTGIHRAVIMEAQAVAATFTRISSKVFPDVIEQASNMSTIFNQDMKQSVVQLGTALNDPIRGVGRLRRIGISFTESQKESIKTFMQQGDIISAQRVILDELEVEIGQVAKAMGEDLPGSIKKSESALKDFQAIIGESVTTWLTPLRDGITGIVSGFNEMKMEADALESLNKKLREYAETSKALLPESVSVRDIGLPSGVTIQELEVGLKEYRNLLDEEMKARTEARTAGDIVGFGGADPQELVAFQQNIDFFKERIMLFEKELKLRKQIKDVGSVVDPEGLEKAETWLENLRQQSKYRNEMLVAEKELNKFDREKLQNTADYNKIMEKGISLGLTRNQIEEALQQYHSNRLKAIKEEERIYFKIQDLQDFGSEGEIRLAEYTNRMNALNEAVARGNVTQEQANEKIKEYTYALNQIPYDVSTTSFSEYITGLQLGWDITVDKAKLFEESLMGVNDALVNLAAGAGTEAFMMLGEMLAGGSMGADDFTTSIAKLAQQTLASLSPMFLMAAATAAIARDYGNAALYLGLAASTGVAAGALNAGMSSGSTGSNTSTSTTPVSSSAITGVSVDTTSDFNATDQTMNRSVVNVNNYGDNSIDVTESVDSTGRRQIDIMVQSSVNRGFSEGSFDRALGNRGVQPPRVNVG